MNIEADILAKHIERLVEPHIAGNLASTEPLNYRRKPSLAMMSR